MVFHFLCCSVYIYPNISAVSIGLYLQPAARVFGGTVLYYSTCGDMLGGLQANGTHKIDSREF